MNTQRETSGWLFRKVFILMVILIVGSSHVFGEENKNRLPSQATEALEKMEKEINEAKAKAVCTLDRVLVSIMKTGDLGSANKVKEEIEKIKSTLALSKEEKWYIGKWKSVYPVGLIWSCSINEDGTVSRTDAKGTMTGTWKLENNSIIFSWPHIKYYHKLFIGNKVNNLYTIEGKSGDKFKLQFLDEKK